MRRFLLPLLVAVVVLSPAWASEPGSPLDCSDWVFLEPGLSCTTIAQPYEDGLFNGLGGSSVTNDGKMLRALTQRTGEVCGTAGPEAIEMERLELWSTDGVSSEVLAYVEERCVDFGTRLVDLIGGGASIFDEENGRLLIWGGSSCAQSPDTDCYEYQTFLIAIEGFTATFEVLQTYTPTANEVSFRVPYMPEGFQHADYFDTYYGSLTNPIDFSDAQPLQCGYPASPPSVGDCLTVADPLPDPPVNTGRYYVTSVSYMGQRRYGRQNNGEVLSGRNPANLPLCEQTEEQP